MKYWNNEKEVPYPHSVLLAAANSEQLLKFIKAATLKDEVVDWLNDNIGKSGWDFYLTGIVAFTSEIDAMSFILRWS